MKKIALPVIKGNPGCFPNKSLFCPWCKKNKVFEPNSMAILTLETTGCDDRPKKHVANKAADKLSLYLVWHGAHDGGAGSDRDMFKTVYVVEDVESGGVDLMFCSTPCLRAFLNACVDELEREIRRKPARKRGAKKHR